MRLQYALIAAEIAAAYRAGRYTPAQYRAMIARLNLEYARRETA